MYDLPIRRSAESVKGFWPWSTDDSEPVNEPEMTLDEALAQSPEYQRLLQELTEIEAQMQALTDLGATENAQLISLRRDREYALDEIGQLEQRLANIRLALRETDAAIDEIGASEIDNSLSDLAEKKRIIELLMRDLATFISKQLSRNGRVAG